MKLKLVCFKLNFRETSSIFLALCAHNCPVDTAIQILSQRQRDKLTFAFISINRLYIYFAVQYMVLTLGQLCIQWHNDNRGFKP